MPWVRVAPVWKPEVVGLCGHPYYGHGRGCSNFCKRPGCPPTMIPLEICLDECYFIYIKYHLGKHIRRMQKAHPEWSLPMCRNIRHWQGPARKILKAEIAEFQEQHPTMYVLGPKVHLDSWGIDMTETMARAGVEITWSAEWELWEWTVVMRYAGFPISKATPSRMEKLRRQYPAIYHRRVGRCEGCVFRPCLKYMDFNAEFYVSKVVNGVKILKTVGDRGWVVCCESCGRKFVVSKGKPFCQASLCKCGYNVGLNKKLPKRA